MLIRNARVFLDGAFRTGVDVRLHHGCVQELGSGLENGLYEDSLDLGGDFLLPGFVDVHIHAFRGHDTMDGYEAIRQMSRDLYRMGVSTFLPTTMSASPEATRAVMDAVRRVMRRGEGGCTIVPGAHLEAPFLAPAKAGAQQKGYFMNPSMDALDLLCGGYEGIRMITVAPEKPGAESFVRAATECGIHVSIGHSGATGEMTHRAADWGADHVTHTFNAQSALHHRNPGIPGAAMTDDRLYCEAICDGVHLHPDVVRMMARCKGANRLVAVTDAMEAAGLPDGSYSLGGQAVTVRDRQARLCDGTLAGSVLTMPEALENLIAWGVAPEQAIMMCTATPATSIGEKKAGRILPGSPAPLTRWTADFHMVGILD